MSNTITKQYADELLCNLLLEHRIIHDDVNSCFKQHGDEIKGMMSIFEHKTNKDRQLSLTLFNLLTPEQGEEVITYYSKEYNLSVKPDVSRDDVKLLLTACLKNKAFFSYALRVCERIKSRLSENCLAEFHHYDPIRMRHAAAPADDNFNEFFHDDSIVHNNINGTLFFKGNRKNQVYLEFVFAKYQSTIPFKLELSFVTTNDKKKHTIDIPADKYVISDEEEDCTAIRSETVDIDYSGGIESYTIRLKPLTNP